ncbi:MAG: VPLPA-CTERM sorting domain-containing protein [Gammaproteobacteria bacterium]|nr:VPLPA-CTERM sorting domain-containing protein [Gammaproteobacteria bacterium]
MNFKSDLQNVIKHNLARTLKLATFIALFSFSAHQARAAIITFDDVTTRQTSSIVDGYNGFDWSDIQVGGGTPAWWPGSGFENGRVSEEYVAWAPGLIPQTITLSAGGVFDFNGAYFTSAWNTGLNITVEGLLNGSVIYDSALLFNTDIPTWFSLNFSAIDALRISAGGGVNAGLGGSGEFWVMDNFTFNEAIPGVPIPAAIWLFCSGLLGLVGMARRKKT